MSTLNIGNYEEHRPHSMIIQNKQIVPEVSADRTSLVLIGSSGGQLNPDYEGKGLITISSTDDINKKLLTTTSTTPIEANKLYYGATMAFSAGGGKTFYVIDTYVKSKASADAASKVTIADQEVNLSWDSAYSCSGILSLGARTSKVISFDFIPDSKKVIYRAVPVCDSTSGLTTDYAEIDNVNFTDVSATGYTIPQFDVTVADADATWAAKYPLSVPAIGEVKVSTAAGEDWDTALKVLGNSDRMMFVCPLTYDPAISVKVKLKGLELSSSDVQRWKRTYQGIPADPTNQKDNLNDLRGLTSANRVKSIIDGISAYSAGLSDEANQRSVNIWSAGAYNYALNSATGKIETTSVPNMYIAAGVAALRAASLPQQGLSMKELSWVSSIPDNYMLFDKTDLNAIAVGSSTDSGVGTMIIAQDDEGSNPYIRHQLTGDLTRGILYYEDSVGVNVDTICYGIKDIIKPYIGQRNNTQTTLVEIRNRITDYLLDLTNTGVDLDARRIGPQINAVDLESIVVSLDSDLRDRVVCSFDIEVALPINTIKVHVNAYADLNDR